MPNKFKEPWQMTQKEWLTDVGYKSSQGTRVKENWIGTHEGEVRVAIQNNKPVPTEVLKDYPDLIPSLREMVVSKTYPGAPSGIQITVFPTRSFSRPDKFSLYDSVEGAYFGIRRDTFQEAVEAANKENIRMYGKHEVPREPVKGEQTGMLGVPGKVHTQKPPYKAGQMEFESYAKYKEAMPFIKVGDRVRCIGEIKGRRGTWPEGVWLEKGMEGTVTEYYPPGRYVPGPGEGPIEAYAVVKFDNGASSAIDPKDEGERWERVTTKPSESDLHWKTVAELKQMCSQRGLPTDGGKEDLIRRLK